MQGSEKMQHDRSETAYEFAKNRLKNTDEPISPATLADEYGCSGGHMRSVLCDLVRDGYAERIAHGRYVEGQGPENQEADIQSNETAQAAANTADKADIQPDALGSVSPGWALVGATMLVVVVAIVTAPTVDESEPVEDDRDGQPDGWA